MPYFLLELFFKHSTFWSKLSPKIFTKLFTPCTAHSPWVIIKVGSKIFISAIKCLIQLSFIHFVELTFEIFENLSIFWKEHLYTSDKVYAERTFSLSMLNIYLRMSLVPFIWLFIFFQLIQFNTVSLKAIKLGKIPNFKFDIYPCSFPIINILTSFPSNSKS